MVQCFLMLSINVERFFMRMDVNVTLRSKYTACLMFCFHVYRFIIYVDSMFRYYLIIGAAQARRILCNIVYHTGTRPIMFVLAD